MHVGAIKEKNEHDKENATESTRVIRERGLRTIQKPMVIGFVCSVVVTVQPGKR